MAWRRSWVFYGVEITFQDGFKNVEIVIDERLALGTREVDQALYKAQKAIPYVADYFKLLNILDGQYCSDSEREREIFFAHYYPLCDVDSPIRPNEEMEAYYEELTGQRAQQSAQSSPPPYTSKPVDKSGYVYLLQSPTGAYKIGRTKNPKDRIKTFKTTLPFEVEYLCLIYADDMYALEKMLHKELDYKRVNGEWFNLDADEVEIIMSLGNTEV